jgi:hypothetical protein
MNTVFRWFGSATTAVVLAAVVVAQAPALEIRMGLWEFTSTTEIGGQMPVVDTNKMTPEQKAKVEAAMKAMLGTRSNVAKTCMTKEKLDKSVLLMEDQPGVTCKQALTTNTRTSLEATITCAGAHSMTGQMHVDALSPTSIKGTITSSSSGQGRTMTVDVAMTGKWLGADCGDVK